MMTYRWRDWYNKCQCGAWCGKTTIFCHACGVQLKARDNRSPWSPERKRASQMKKAAKHIKVAFELLWYDTPTTKPEE